MEWVVVVQDRNKLQAVMNMVVNVAFLDWMRNYKLLKKNYVLWS
jgi:hypothetical protein